MLTKNIKFFSNKIYLSLIGQNIWWWYLGHVSIAHQDDYYESRYAEKVLDKMKKTSDVLIGYSDYFEEKMVLRSLQIQTSRLKP